MYCEIQIEKGGILILISEISVILVVEMSLEGTVVWTCYLLLHLIIPILCSGS